VVSVADPAKPVQLACETLPAGHTTSCVDGCRYLWTGGPAKADSMPAEWGGRPVWVTDVRDPRHPRTFPLTLEPDGTGATPPSRRTEWPVTATRMSGGTPGEARGRGLG
jgi:hypothetical protein